ncbi:MULTISPECIES: hypothetical protein [Providencia]|uniref:hypothetical protein n=1 Tax=Providencia TaxID=586 RepID=UPI000C7E94F2|nr:hypothetical protein [Providencia huaxiensis]AXH61197.1 hypothetical protein CYG50_03680 [Providencia huaxiensis]
MLDLIKRGESTAVILSVIRDLTGEATFAIFDGIVTVTVQGKKIIDEEEIQIQLTYSPPNYAVIDILWEICGYKNYKDMGLHGRMSTQYQQAKKSGLRRLTLINDNYTIDIMY